MMLGANPTNVKPDNLAGVTARDRLSFRRRSAPAAGSLGSAHT